MTCGLCCDGTFFSEVRVGGADQVEPLKAAGLLPAGAGPGDSFPQPCGALHGGCCQVYAERPAACRAFRCLTLRRLDSGEIDLAKARDIVAQALALQRDVRVVAGERALPGCTDVDVLMALAAFDRFAARHFTTIQYRGSRVPLPGETDESSAP